MDERIAELDGSVGVDLVTPLDGIEEEYLLYNQMRYNWLTYRIAVRTHFGLFMEGEFDSQKPGKSLLKSWREARDGPVLVDVDTPNMKRIAEIDGEEGLKKRKIEVASNGTSN